MLDPTVIAAVPAVPAVLYAMTIVSAALIGVFDIGPRGVNARHVLSILLRVKNRRK